MIYLLKLAIVELALCNARELRDEKDTYVASVASKDTQRMKIRNV